MNDETIKFFNEEMENVVLSLDGRKEVHDAIRKTVNGKGSFDYVIGNIKKFVSLRGNKSYYVRGTFTAKNLDFSKDVLFIADQGLDSISMEPVVTDLPDLEIKEEHLPAIEREYENLCDEYLKRYAEGKGFNFFHFNIDLEGLAFPNGSPPAGPETNTFPSFRTAISIPVTNSRGTRISIWETCATGSLGRRFGKNSKIPVCSPAKSAGTVSQNSFVRAAATPTIIILTAI